MTTISNGVFLFGMHVRIFWVRNSSAFRRLFASAGFVLMMGYSYGFGQQEQESAGALPKAPTAKEVLSDVSKRARAEHKQILLIFGASWCRPCRMLEEYLDQPKLARILKKYYIYAKLDAFDKEKKPELENDGAEELIEQSYGKQSSLPSIAILAEDGSLRWNFMSDPSNKNSGRYTMREGKGEIGPFLRMLHDASPAISMQDLRALRKFLENAAEGASKKEVMLGTN